MTPRIMVSVKTRARASCACAERRAHRHLADPLVGPREQKARDIRRRDEQHQHAGAEQQRQRRGNGVGRLESPCRPGASVKIFGRARFTDGASAAST